MGSTLNRPAPAVQEAWSLLAKLFWQMRPRMLSVAAEFGLTPPQMFALRALDPATPMPMRDLAARLHCDSSNVTGLVDGLEAHGLVERRPAAHDRRVKMISVTDEGAELRRRALARVFEPHPAIAALSPEDQRALRDVMRRVVA